MRSKATWADKCWRFNSSSLMFDGFVSLCFIIFSSILEIYENRKDASLLNIVCCEKITHLRLFMWITCRSLEWQLSVGIIYYLETASTSNKGWQGDQKLSSLSSVGESARRAETGKKRFLWKSGWLCGWIERKTSFPEADCERARDQAPTSSSNCKLLRIRAPAMLLNAASWHFKLSIFFLTQQFA